MDFFLSFLGFLRPKCPNCRIRDSKPFEDVEYVNARDRQGNLKHPLRAIRKSIRGRECNGCHQRFKLVEARGAGKPAHNLRLQV